MVNFSFISLLSAVISFCAIFIVFGIFNKVYSENYKKPWLFIGISAIILVISEIITFFFQSFGFNIISISTTEFILYFLRFVTIVTLTYGLLLEYMILRYYKGKFVKMKFIPVQEGTLGGDLDLNVNTGESYYSFKGEEDFLNNFTSATKKGFEGFLLTEDSPSEIRKKYKLEKTPIAWITKLQGGVDETYLKDNIDENSDIVDPLQLNNLISYIDNFLEQSQNPFILIDLNLLVRVNNFAILSEFLKYIANKIQRYNGICLIRIDKAAITDLQMNELKSFLKII